MRFLLLLLVLVCAQAQAQQYYVQGGTSYTYTAQGVAERMAQTGQCRHFGNPTGGYEGVGFSPNSPEQAKRNCCYYGRRPIRDVGVARGPRGWFACVRYH